MKHDAILGASGKQELNVQLIPRSGQYELHAS